MNRRHLIVALLAGAGLAACGRRGPLEPPPYTAQGQEWQRRQGRNPDGTRREPGQRPAQGRVQEGLQRERDARTTVDVEGDIERRSTEGTARTPSDPTQTDPGGAPVTPSISPQSARRRPPGIVPPKRDFILDPLL
ncbi:MAG: LPS translocon maturation chaperone LptM [Beijerinckiaceae bacterium]